MTNIITSILAKIVVCLVTNVVSSDNAKWAPDYSIAYTTFPATYENRIVTAATERYRTTNIEQITTIEWEFPGAPSGSHEIERKMLSSVTAILKLKQDWEPAGLKTNAVEVAKFISIIAGQNQWLYTK